MKIGEIWVQKDNGSRWKIIGMSGNYGFWKMDGEDIIRENNEGVILECVEARPPMNPETPEERLLRDIFGGDSVHGVGFIFELSRSEFVEYYKKEYS